MDFKIKKVDGVTRNDPLDANETIYDNFKIKAQYVSALDIYFRPKELCPLGKDNWIIDLKFKNGYMIVIRLMENETEQRIFKFVKPLIDDLERIKNG